LSGNIKKFITKNGLSTQNIELKSNTASFDINAVANTLDVASSNTQLFSINDSNTGVIFSVNNTDELPYIEVQANGDIRLAEIEGKVLIGLYSSNSNTKFQVEGGISTDSIKLDSLIANNSVGSNGQILTSNGTISYWANPEAGFSNGQSIAVQDLVVNGAFTANGSNGAAGQVLSSNGSSVYWSNVDIAATFTDLTDTPASYANSEGYVVTVNPTANGLVFSNDLQTQLNQQQTLVNLMLIGS
jgi:hypothetical protein